MVDQGRANYAHHITTGPEIFERYGVSGWWIKKIVSHFNSTIYHMAREIEAFAAPLPQILQIKGADYAHHSTSWTN